MTGKKRAAPGSRPLICNNQCYFAGFTLDLVKIEPAPSRPSTSTVTVKAIPPVLVTPTRPKSAREAAVLPGMDWTCTLIAP